MLTKILMSVLTLAIIASACSQHDSNSGMKSLREEKHSLTDHRSDSDEIEQSEMTGSPGAAEAPYDLQFLDTMVAHDQVAIEMARLVDSRAGNPELKILGGNMIASHEKEIGEMKSWREKWFANDKPAVNVEMAGIKDSIKEVDVRKLHSLNGNDFDLEFIRQMIPHHEGAIVTAKEALQKAEHAEIKTLASAIIKAQEAEIEKMRDWQSKWSK